MKFARKNRLKGQTIDTYIGIVVALLILGIITSVGTLANNSVTNTFTGAAITTVINESQTANTTSTFTLSNVPIEANTQNISQYTGTTQLDFVEGADYTIVDGSGVVTWLNSTANETLVNISYTYRTGASTEYNVGSNASEMFLNFGTQLPTTGTLLGVGLLLLVLFVGIAAVVSRRMS